MKNRGKQRQETDDGEKIKLEHEGSGAKIKKNLNKLWLNLIVCSYVVCSVNSPMVLFFTWCGCGMTFPKHVKMLTNNVPKQYFLHVEVFL